MMELISIRTFFSEYIDRTDVQPEELAENIILNFAITAAQKMQTQKQCEHIVKLVRVSNYNAELPSNMFKIMEVAYTSDALWKERYYHLDEVVKYTNHRFEECDISLSIDCPDCNKEEGRDYVRIEVDDNWRKANSDRKYWNIPYYRGTYGINKPLPTSVYHPEFMLAHPAQHRFFGANYHVNGCVNLDKVLLANSPIEYKVENKRLRINMEEGTVLIAYLGIPLDDEGFPLIPNDPDVFEAIFWDVESKMLYRNKRKMEGNLQLSFTAKELAEVHLTRAKNKLSALSFEEWRAMIKKFQRVIPYTNITNQAGRMLSDRGQSMMNKRYR